MDKEEYSDDQLNMYVDNQLDAADKAALLKVLVNNPDLRSQACELRVVKELVQHAYNNVQGDYKDARTGFGNYFYRAVAATLLLGLGILLGWQTHKYQLTSFDDELTAESAFSFYTEQAIHDFRERKIILHITTDEDRAVDAALDEVETLLMSYRQAATPLNIDIVANKTGINLFRLGVSHYLTRIQEMMSYNNVSLYACVRSIDKMQEWEGVKVELLPQTIKDQTARELIPKRIKQGWAYFRV